MSGMFHKLMLMIVGVALLLPVLPASAASAASPVMGDPLVAISDAKRKDPQELAAKVDRLRESQALMDTLSGAPDAQTVQTYLEFFAAISTVQQVEAFVARTEGKRFEIRGQGDEQTVVLVTGLAISARSCCACWQAWVASAAYYVGSGLLCTAVGAGGAAFGGGVGAVSGFVCGGVFWAIEKLPNFNNACK